MDEAGKWVLIVAMWLLSLFLLLGIVYLVHRMVVKAAQSRPPTSTKIGKSTQFFAGFDSMSTDQKQQWAQISSRESTASAVVPKPARVSISAKQLEAAEKGNKVLVTAVLKSEVFAPPPSHIHDSQRDVDEGSETEVPRERRESLMYLKEEKEEEFKMKPQTPIEMRRVSRFKEKQDAADASKARALELLAAAS